MIRDRRPLALQVSDGLRELIAEELTPGGRLPSEWALVSRFDVGRTTVREALKLLEQEGIIDTHRGRGRYVTAEPVVHRSVTRLESVSEMMEDLGFHGRTVVLEVIEDAATDDERTALDLPIGEAVVRLRRLRLQEEIPLIYSVDVFARSLVDGPVHALDWSGSLLARLETNGRRITGAMTRMRAVNLPGPVAREIGPRARGPWLLMVQTNVTDAGRPVLYSHDYHRGDSFTFNVLRRRALPSRAGDQR